MTSHETQEQLNFVITSTIYSTSRSVLSHIKRKVEFQTSQLDFPIGEVILKIGNVKLKFLQIGVKDRAIDFWRLLSFEMCAVNDSK